LHERDADAQVMLPVHQKRRSLMIVHSLGYKTDLIINRFAGVISDHGSCISVHTPSNPKWHWGNYVLFERAPNEGDLVQWRTKFEETVGIPPNVEHYMFGWDTSDGYLGNIYPLIAKGFQISTDTVLTAANVVMPVNFDHDLIIRPITQDWEWEAIFENQIACLDQDYPAESTIRRKRLNMNMYRQMTDAGLGAWFGAIVDGRIVGDLGIFVGDGLGRFQMVGTHPQYRRRGICSTLVYYASRFAFERLNARKLVLVADPTYHAILIYESLGFSRTELQVRASRSQLHS